VRYRWGRRSVFIVTHNELLLSQSVRRQKRWEALNARPVANIRIISAIFFIITLVPKPDLFLARICVVCQWQSSRAYVIYTVYHSVNATLKLVFVLSTVFGRVYILHFITCTEPLRPRYACSYILRIALVGFRIRFLNNQSFLIYIRQNTTVVYTTITIPITIMLCINKYIW